MYLKSKWEETMADIEFIKNLSGHSGCGLKLYRSENMLFVRKDSGNPGYNRRLKKQCIKQQRFRLGGVKTPEVLGCGQKNGLFYFDMEFLNGVTLAEYMNCIKIKEINHLISLLFKSLPLASSQNNPRANKIFHNKIAGLRQSIGKTDALAAKALQKLEKYDYSNIPASYCCGDLTLENIILSEDKQVYLIDFLDSFYNSWMIDVAKLLQDLELRWSYRHSKIDFNLNMRLAVAREALIENISEFSDGRQMLLSIYHLLLLNVLRIYPYAKDAVTAEFLQNAVFRVLQIIADMENQK